MAREGWKEHSPSTHAGLLLRLQADRDGKHRGFADKYEGSDLRRRNARALAEHMSDSAQVPPQLLRELAIKRETTNPWYYGVWTLLQVRAPCVRMHDVTARNPSSTSLGMPRLG